MPHLEELKVVVLPGWILRSMLRNGLNVQDITSYSKLRKCLSLDDLAVLRSANEIKLDMSGYISTYPLECIFHNTTNVEMMEYNNSVLPLINTNDIKQQLDTKLKTSNDIVSIAYSFIKINGIIVVVVNEGFLTYLSNYTNKLNFIREYLENCYSMETIVKVSQLTLFSSYIKLLAVA